MQEASVLRTRASSMAKMADVGLRDEQGPLTLHATPLYDALATALTQELTVSLLEHAMG